MSKNNNMLIDNLRVKSLNIGSKYDEGQNDFETDDLKIRNKIDVGKNITIGKEKSDLTLDLKAVNAIRIPVGKTIERPLNPQPGYIRYNSELMIYEGYLAVNIKDENGNVTGKTYDWIQISGGISL